MNIYFQEETYSKIKSLIAKREVSRFINEAVEEKLLQKAQEDKKELRERLIAGYQRQAKNKNLQEMLRIYGEISWQDISTELALRENKNDQHDK